MYEYISGIVESASPGAVVIEAAGLGYEINIPLSTFEKIPEKEVVKLYLHHYVREDMEKLFGFYTESEREVFRSLINISGVGPKAALSVLSGVSVDDILNAVYAQNANVFKSAPGIGAKTAQRIVIELKDKLKLKPENNLGGDDETGQKNFSNANSVRDDAFAALISLGYNENQVRNALKRVEEITGSQELGVEDYIRKALKVI